MSYQINEFGIFDQAEMLSASELMSFGQMNSIDQLYTTTPTEESIVNKSQSLFNEIFQLRDVLMSSQAVIDNVTIEFENFKQKHQHCESIIANLKYKEEKAAKEAERSNFPSVQPSMSCWKEKRHSLEKHARNMKKILNDKNTKDLERDDFVIIERAVMSTCNAIDGIVNQIDNDQSINEADISKLFSNLGEIKEDVNKQMKTDTMAKKQFILMQDSLLGEIEPVIVFNSALSPPNHYVELKQKFDNMYEEKQELDVQMDKANKEIIELKQKLDSSDALCHKMEDLLSEKDDRIKSLQDEIDERSFVLPSTPNDKDARIRELESECTKLKSELSIINGLQNELMVTKQDLFETSQSNETLTDENDNLQLQLRNSQFKCSQLQKELAEQNNAVKDFERKIVLSQNESSKQAENLQNTIKELELACVKLQEEKNEIQAKLQKNESHPVVERPKSEMEVLDKEYQQVKIELEEIKKRLKRDTTTLRKQNLQLTKELEAAKEKIKLNESNSSLNTTGEADSSLFLNDSVSIVNISDVNDSINKNDELLEELQSKYQEKEDVLTNLYSYLQKKEEEILQNDGHGAGNFEPTERIAVLLRNYDQKLLQMKKEYQKLLESNTTGTEKLKNFEEICKENHDLKEKLEECYREISNYKEQIKELNRKLSNFSEEKANLEEQLAVQCNEADGYQNETIEYKEEIEYLVTEMKSYKKKVSEMEALLAQKEADIENLKADHEKQYALLNDKLEKSRQDYRDTWQKGQASLREEEEKVEYLRGELHNYQKQFDQVVRAKDEEVNQHKLYNQNLERAKASAESEVEASKIQMEIYKSDFDAEREAREKQQGELIRRREEVDNLKEQVDGLKREIHRITNQNFRRSQYKPNENVNNEFDRRGDNRYSFHGNEEWQPHARQDREEIKEMSCPKCQQKFPDGESLQIHFISCLE